MDYTEQSFILIKPDINEKHTLKKEIEEQIHKEFAIKDIKEVYISSEDIDVLWPYCKHDPVCHWLMEDYLLNKKMILYILTGEGVLKNVKSFKREVRKKYARSPFQNCIHTPSDFEEYNKDIRCLLKIKDDNEIVFNDKTPECNFKGINKCSKEEMERCAEKISSKLKSTTFKEECIRRTRKESNYIYILNDDVHDARYVVGAILEVLPWFDLFEAYWIAMGVDFEGKYPLIDCQDGIDVNEICNILKEYGIETERVWNENR